MKNLYKINKLDPENKLRSFKRKYRTKIYNQSMMMVLLLQEDCLKQAKNYLDRTTVNLYMGDMFHQTMKVAKDETQRGEVK